MSENDRVNLRRGIVYFKNVNEMRYIKARAAQRNRTLSSHIRDLLIADLVASGNYHPDGFFEPRFGETETYKPQAAETQTPIDSTPQQTIPSIASMREVADSTNVMTPDLMDLFDKKEE